jgi:hypothetical protein
MKKIAMTLTLVFFFAALANAQDYKTGIGLRGGYYYGLTVKHFIGTKSALEGLVTTHSGFDVTGLYEIHNRAFDVDRLNWYYGLGAHVGFWEGAHLNSGVLGTNYTIIGIDGILGIEYNIREAPLNISLDWKPAFNIIGYSEFWPLGGAFSIRYIF